MSNESQLNTEYEIQIESEVVEQITELLRESNKLFYSGENGGRVGVLRSLEVAATVLNIIPPIAEENLLQPLAMLHSVIQQLSLGILHPLLMPENIPRNLTDSPIRQLIKAHVAHTYDLLTSKQLGGMKRPAACSAIRKTLKDCAFKTRHDTEVDTGTVGNWAHEARSKKHASTEMGRAYWAFKKVEYPFFKNNKPERIQGFALLNLEHLILSFRAYDAP
jgi:hypothetical protein